MPHKYYEDMFGMMNLKDFEQALGAEAVEGTHGEVSCAPGGGFHILIYGYTPHGQERAVHAFAKFARLVEIGEDGARLFAMSRLPTPEEAQTLRRWLAFSEPRGLGLT